MLPNAIVPDPFLGKPLQPEAGARVVLPGGGTGACVSNGVVSLRRNIEKRYTKEKATHVHPNSDFSR